MVAVVDGVEHQFDPGGDAQLVENAKQILLYGVFAECQLLGDIPIREPFRDQGDHLLLARSQQAAALHIHHSKRRHLGNQIDEVVDLFGGSPDLAAVDDLYALPRAVQR